MLRNAIDSRKWQQRGAATFETVELLPYSSVSEYIRLFNLRS